MGVGNEKWIICFSAVLVICGFGAAAAHGHSHGDDHHGCGHAHHHHHHEDDHRNHVHRDEVVAKRQLLPEELAEEEDLKSHGFGYGGGDHHQHSAELSGIGLWMHAMGCSLLVSLASLICLVFLPLIFIQGKPSKAVVDSLALFGAGAMLGDAFLHQLPHAFGGEHSHSHDHHSKHHHSHPVHEHLPSHSHSLEGLSVGLSILAGIILFLLVEKLVRYVEGSSGTSDSWSHGHHHHHAHSKKLITDNDNDDENLQGLTKDEKNDSPSADSGDNKVQEEFSADASNGEKHHGNSVLRKRNVGTGSADDEDNRNSDTCAAENVADRSAPDGPADKIKETLREPAKLASSLVFGYLNLFSDGVHNFTDGMALGSAFLLYGSIGGWSRTLFLLAHELPQEIGDFGILVRSGFSVSKALFFNFLSALVALVGTAMALMLGQNPGQSSLIEGFTAGGFIYISVAGVLAEMNSGTPKLKSTTVQLLSLLTGMGVALCISLVE